MLIFGFSFPLPISSPLNSGDVWCISAAIASAMFILRLDKFSKQNDPAVASLDLRAPEREAGSGGQGKRCAGSGAKG